MPATRPLRLWLALRLALAGMVPLAVVGALVVGVLLPQLHADLERRHQTLARAITSEIATHLLGAQRELRAIADEGRRQGHQPAPFWFGLLDAHAGTGEVFAAIYITDSNDSVYAVGLAEAQRGQRADLLGLDLSGRPFLRQAREQNKMVWSDTFLSAVTGQVSVTLAVPMGERLLVGEIALGRLSQFLGQMPAEPGMLTMIFDREGQVIAHSQEALSGQQLSLVHLPTVRDALQGKFASGSFELNGEAFLGTTVSVPQLGWIALVAQPRAQALRPFLSTLWVLATGVLAGLAATIIVALVLARGFARRIGRYAEQIHAIAEGSYDKPWPVTRIREFDELTGNLEGMSLAIRQREWDLATSEARYRSVISNAPVVMFQFDEDGVVSLSEGKGLSRTGLAEGKAVGQSLFEFYGAHPEVCEHARRALGGEPQQFTTWIGDAFVDMHLNPVRDDKGRIQVMGVSVDLTERQRAEDALRESEARLRSAIENVPFEFFLMGADGRYFLQNSTCRKAWGNVVGLRPEDVAPDAAMLALWKRNNNRAFAGEIVKEEVRSVVGHEEKYIYNIIAPIKDGDEIRGVVGLNIDVTDRKRAEQALQKGEIKYRRLYESTMDAIVTVDMAGRIQESNQAYQAMLGYSAEELGTLTYIDLTPEKWHDYETKIVEQQILTRGYSDVYEKEYRRKDGTIFAVELRTFLLRDEADQPAGMWAIVRDIAERKAAEKALQASETRFRDLSAMASDWFWEQDEQFRFTYVSSTETMSTLARLGGGFTELLGKTHWELPIDLTPDEWSAHRALLEAHRPFRDFEYRMRAQSGADRWFNISGKPLFDDAGRFVGYRGTGRDITERKQVEAALRESERLFRAVFEQAPHFIGILDLEGNILKANATSTDFAGTRLEDVFGKPFWEAPWWSHSLQERERLRDAIRRAAQGESIHFETTHPNPEGELHIVDFTLKPVRDEAGKVVALVPEGRDITERKHAEEALRQSRHLLEIVLDTIPARVFWKDRNSNYLGCNRAFAHDAGLDSASDVIGRDDYQLGWRKQAEIYRSDDRKVFDSGTPKIDYEEPQTTPDGHHTWLRTSKIPLRDADGQVFGILGTYQDITEHKRREEALRRANRRLRILSDANQALARINDEIALLTEVCDIAVNQGGYRMARVGYVERGGSPQVRAVAHASMEEDSLQNTAVPGADDALDRAPFTTAIRTGRPCVVQKSAGEPWPACQRAAGGECGCAAMCALPLMAGEETFGVLGVFTCGSATFDDDEIELLSELATNLALGVTVLRARVQSERASQALKESEFLLRRSQEVGDLGSYYLDARDGAWISSEKLDQILGIDATFPKTTSGWIELVHPDCRQEMLQYLTEHVLAKRNKFDKEYRIIRRDDGHERWVHGLGELEFDEDGVPVKMIGTVQDITQTKRAAEELRRHREHLEELVSERTSELRQAMQQLMQAEKLAALGNLVAGVAHELNTPLGNARLVATSLGEKVRAFGAAADAGRLRRSQLEAFLAMSREAVELLERNAARAADLIGHFKQVAIDQTSVRRRCFALRQTVLDLLATLQPQFNRTAHRVEVEIPPKLELDSYPGPLEQVLANLVGNSLAYGFAGINEGLISIHATSPDPALVRIEYEDNGVGIPEATLPRIFEPFFTTGLGSGGSGLGLYIAYNLVTGVLGGTMEVHSGTGAGVRFTLLLPRIAPDRSSLGPRD